MKRENFYAVVIILLLLLNFATIGYLLINRDTGQVRHTPPMHHNPERIITEELNLDEDQIRQFRVYKHQHGRATDSVQRQIKELQVELFSLVKAEEMDIPKRDSLLSKIEQLESARHLIIIEHFHDIRSMMREDQVKLFNGFVEEMGSTITEMRRPGHRPPPHHRRH